MKRKIELPDAMDDDCRRLTQEMPEGVLQDEAEVRPAKRMSAEGCLRAFTVHPCWAWAIMEGVKTQEWRTFLPHPGEGVCAIHVSRSYCRAQWEFEAKQVRKQFGVKLIPYEELVADWCGKVVGVCDYAANEDDLDGIEYGWRLSNVRPLKHRIACKGALKLWTMGPKLAKQVLKELE